MPSQKGKSVESCWPCGNSAAQRQFWSCIRLVLSPSMGKQTMSWRPPERQTSCLRKCVNFSPENAKQGVLRHSINRACLAGDDFLLPRSRKGGAGRLHVKQCTFHPAEKGGNEIPVFIDIEVNFRI